MWESVLPSGRRTISFTRAGAAAGLLLSQFPLRPITNKALEGKENPKNKGFWRKPPKRRLWRMKRGGFEEVSAGAHTGNLSPTVEQQISSTGRVAAVLIEVSQFPASTNFRWQLLSAKEEVLKPKVSSGVFFILFVAADKKYAAGDNRKSHSSETIGKSCCPLTTKKGALKPPVSGLPISLHTTLTSAAASYSTATAPPSPDRRAPTGTDPFRGSRCPR